MNVVIPQQLERAVKEKIASGKYRSAEELVTEAVSRLIEEENAAPRDLSWLEKELQAGLDSPTRENDRSRFGSNCGSASNAG